jgi:hypothetical protein
MRRPVRAVRAVVSGLAASAVVLATATAASATGVRVNESKYGFTLTLPPGWTAPPLTAKGLSQFLSNATKVDPSLASSVNSELKAGEESEVRMLAFAPIKANSKFATNFNVLSTPQTLPSISALESLAKSELTSFHNATFTTPTKGKLGTVVLATYSAKLTTGATAYGTQIYCSHHGSTYLLTYTGGSASQSTFNQILSTWRWTS